MRRARAITLAAVAYPQALPAVQAQSSGLVGCSLGALWAFRLSVLRPDDSAVVVACDGTVADVDVAAARAAPRDPDAEHEVYERHTAVRALDEQIRAAGREVTFHHYAGTAHWCRADERPEYDRQAAHVAWKQTSAVLRHTLRSG